MRTLVVTFSLLAALSLARAAHASPHALPYSYPYATLGAGQLEVEQYADLTPVPTFGITTATQTTLRGVLTTELEYGITDRLEAGLYFEVSNNTISTDGTEPLQLDGIKQRLRYRIADRGVLPVDISVYGELSEFTNEIELEGKINLEKDFGRLQVLVNLWAEREFYYAGQQEWVLNPTAGASFEITPAVHLGVEYWMHGEFGNTTNAANPAFTAGAAFNPGLHHYIGPALLLQGNKFWWAVAPYVRLDDWNRKGQLGDQYGHFWVRTIVGIEL